MVPSRLRIRGSQTFVLLNFRLESNKEETEETFEAELTLFSPGLCTARGGFVPGNLRILIYLVIYDSG